MTDAGSFMPIDEAVYLNCSAEDLVHCPKCDLHYPMRCFLILGPYGYGSFDDMCCESCRKAREEENERYRAERAAEAAAARAAEEIAVPYDPERMDEWLRAEAEMMQFWADVMYADDPNLPPELWCPGCHRDHRYWQFVDAFGTVHLWCYACRAEEQEPALP